jgi:hypothetical protein
LTLVRANTVTVIVIRRRRVAATSTVAAWNWKVAMVLHDDNNK